MVNLCQSCGILNSIVPWLSLLRFMLPWCFSQRMRMLQDIWSNAHRESASFLVSVDLECHWTAGFFGVLKWSIACRLWSTIFSVNAIEGHRLVHDCIPFILSYPEFFGWRPLDEDLFRVSLILCSIGLKVVVGLQCPIHLHNQFGNLVNLGIFWNENHKSLVAVVINSLIKSPHECIKSPRE